MNIILMKGILINFLITLVTSILSFAVNKYFANYMGAEILGLMKLFTQLIAYLSLAEMGISSAATYALYKPLLEKNIEKINIVVSTMEAIYKKIALIILSLGILISPFIPFFLKNQSLKENLYFLWILYVINTSISYLTAKYNILFTANQEFNFVRIIQGIGKISSQILQIFAIVKYKSFLIFIVLLIFDNIFQYIFYKLHYKQKYRYIKKVNERDKNIIKDLINIFWHKISGLIVYNTDYIVISLFLNLKMVGIYASYVMVTQIVGTIIGILLGVITPKMGKYVAGHNKEEIYEIWKKVNIIFVFIGVIATYTTWKLINPFIKLWIGSEFLLSNLTVLLLMINLFINNTRSITEIIKNSSGFFDDIHLPIMEGLINLIISIIFVRKFGINGVIIGTLVSNILIICIAKPILVFRRCFKKSGLKYIELLSKYLALSLTSVYICEAILEYNYEVLNNIDSWSQWFLALLITGCIISIVSATIFMLNTNFRKNLYFLKKKSFI